MNQVGSINIGKALEYDQDNEEHECYNEEDDGANQ